jgi:hypothetical protein
MKRPRPSIVNRISTAAPYVSLVLLLVMARWLPNRVQADDRPFFIGDSWVGEDLRDLLAPEAQKLLRPNAIFNRRYERYGGSWVQVLVVHCSDARDMIGHYPPVCYPSAGWVDLEVPPPGDHVLTAQAATLPVREYRFRAVQEGGRDFEIRIFSAFVLPDGTVTRDISDINRQSERLAVSVQGVAQMQIITPADTPAAEAMEAAGEVLGGLGELFDVLEVTQGAAGNA